MPRPLCLVLALYSSLSVESNTLRGGHQPHGINGDIVQRGHSRKNVNIVGGRVSDRRLLQRIAAMEDATLRSSTPYTNYGHDDDLQFVPSATSPNPNDEADTLIKFDLSLLRGDSATGNSGDQAYYLHLYTSEHCDFASNPMASQLGLLSVGVAENVVSNNVVGSDVNALWEWNEESVTWYNAPSWKQGSEKIVKPLGELEGRAWLEIDITSLVASTTAPILTLRLSSVLYAYSDDNYSLCTFASRDYRRGMYSPRLVMQTQDTNESDAKPIKMLSTTLIEQRQEGEDTRREFESIPHKVFPPKILSETATTTKVTSCAAPYSPLQIYAHGDVVSNDHKNYKCKPYPYTDWCNSDKYEPGVSMHWALAWDLVNDCKTDIQSIHQKDGALDTSFKEPTTFSYSVQDADAEPSAGSPLCPARWNSDYPYRSGDRVTLPSTLTIYECKEEPFGNVCADQAYEVGVEGGVFLNAWKAVGTCVNGRVVENDSTEDFSSNVVQALPSTPQADPMSYEIPTKCNLCRPGQIGINADIDFNGKAMKCMDIYEFYLQNHLEGSKQCIAAQGWLNGICCGDESAMNLEGALATTSSTTSSSTAIFTTAALVPDVSFIPNRLPRPTTPESTTPPPSPGLAQDVYETIVGSPPSLPADNSEEAFVVPNCATPYNKDDYSYYLNKRVSQSEGNYVCMMAHWCSMPDFEPAVGKYWMVVWEYEGPCIDSGTESSNARPVRPTGNISTSVPDADSFVLADEQTNPPSDALADSFIFETTSSPTPPSTQKPTDLVAGDPEVSVSNSGEPLPRPTDLEDSEAAVSVNGSDESECPEPWRLDFAYVEGDQVAVEGQIYTCKEFPYTGWCGLDGYEPTVGSYWDMAWNVGDNCLGQGSQSSLPSPTTNAQVTSTTTIDPSTPASLPAPTTNAQVTSTTTINPSTPASSTTNSPVTSTTTVDPSTPASDVEDYDEDGAPANNTVPITKDMGTGEKVFAILEEKKDAIDNTIFLYQGSEPSTVYRYDGFVAGLRVMFESGVAGKYYYLGDSSENGYKYGLVNLAAFIGQSMKETIQYDACDENSWDLVNGKYPLSNACGQLGQSYQDYHCSDEEKHMECAVDPNMSIRGVTHAKWYGAPGPLFCGPKTEYEFTGYWDYGYGCNNPWADPPEYCEDYEGQQAGRYDNTAPVENVAGRTDVEGCCWWGRGVIQTTGICNFGKLNYFLGARAAEEGRDARYPDVDFCKDPEVICSSQEHQELKWIAGMFYWIESLQSYNERGWDYITELHKFVDGGMMDSSFINGVSGVVNRGCHDPPCGTGDVDGLTERAGNFEKVLSTFLS